MSEREREVDVASNAGLWADDPASGGAPTATGWEAWETPEDHEQAPAAVPGITAERRLPLGGLQPPWLLGALSAALVLLAGALAFAAARRGLDGPLDGRGLVGLGLAAGGALALAALAGWSVSALASRHQQEHLRLQDLLDRVAALDPEHAAAWHEPTLRAESGLARFIDTILARDALQRTALARAAALEQEVACLGTALVDGDRAGVAKTPAEPAVARAATGAMRLYAEIDRLQEAVAALESRLAEAGGQAVAATSDACHWQTQAANRLTGLQGTLQRVGGDAQRLAGAFDEKLLALEEIERSGVPTLAEIQATLPATSGSEQAGHLVQVAHAIKDLVARGGSLAIQTALEVTRLGERGETLFPLTDSLKSLVTEFQTIATRLENAAREQETTGAAVAKARTQLGEIAAASGRDIPEPEAWRRGGVRVADLKLALVRARAELDQLAQTFAEQGARLENLGGVLTELTGLPCAGEPLGSSAPFEVESFTAPALDATETPSAPPSATAPGSAMPLFAEDLPPDASPQKPARPLSGSIFAPEEPRLDLASPAPTPALHAQEERIYDLAELGAVALDEPAATTAADDDRIYDLCELGAVAIG